MLCNVCQNSIQNLYDQKRPGRPTDGLTEGIFVHQIVPRTFHSSIKSGCSICRWMWTNSIGEHLESLTQKFPVLKPPPSEGASFTSTVIKSIETYETFARILSHIFNSSHFEEIEGTKKAKYKLKYATRKLLENNTHIKMDPDEIGSWSEGRPLSYYMNGGYKGTFSNESNEIKFDVNMVSVAKLQYEGVFTPILATGATPRKANLVCSESTKGALDMCKSWISDCMETHQRCSLNLEPGFYPKRLVKISKDDGQEIKWQLSVSHEITEGYLTLSHCWGGSVHLTLTKETNENFINNSNPISTMPKTFRDALEITLALGFRYIWIDSLCILQDDKEDWEEQAAVMGEIYRHSTCNIAASWASNSEHGCYTQRDANIINPTTVEVKHESKMKKFWVSNRSLYQWSIMSAPLNKRGWVVQERSLAPRQLNFTRDQVWWECQEHVACEHFPQGLSHKEVDGDVSRRTFRQTDGVPLRLAWNHLVERYTTCKFTKMEDKIPALAGLASEYRKVTGDTYLAGMWKQDLHRQLLWSVHNQLWEAGEFQAPSWSWASVDCAVATDQRFGRALSHEWSFLNLVRIHDATAISSSPSGLHSFTSGSLKLSAIGLWTKGDLVSAHSTVNLFWRKDMTGYAGQMASVSFNWDHIGSIPRDGKQCLILFICAGRSPWWTGRGGPRDEKRYTMEGIVVEPHDWKGTTLYLRIGVTRTAPNPHQTFPLLNILCDRLGWKSPEDLRHIGVNLSDSRIADMVKTVEIV